MAWFSGRWSAGLWWRWAVASLSSPSFVMTVPPMAAMLVSARASAMSVPASAFGMLVSAVDEMGVPAPFGMSAPSDARGFSVDPSLGMSAPQADTRMTTTAPQTMMVEARSAATSALDMTRVMIVRDE